MGISVKHGKGPIGGYLELGYRKAREAEDIRLREAALAEKSIADEQERKALLAAASIRRDRANLGAKQKQKYGEQAYEDQYTEVRFVEPTEIQPNLTDRQLGDIQLAKSAKLHNDAAKYIAENENLKERLAQEAAEKERIRVEAKQKEKALEEQRKIDAEAGKAQSELQALSAQADTLGFDFENDGYTMGQQRRLQQLQDGIEKVRRDPSFSGKEKALALKQMLDEIQTIKPSGKREKAYTYETDEKGNTWEVETSTGRRAIVDKAEKPKEEKDDNKLTNREIIGLYRDAEKALTKTDAEGREIKPQPDAIEAYVDEMLSRLQARNPPKVPAERAQPPSEVQPRGLTLYDQPPIAPVAAPVAAQPIAPEPAKSIPLDDPIKQEQARKFIRDAKARGLPPEAIRAEFNKLFGAQ